MIEMKNDDQKRSRVGFCIDYVVAVLIDLPSFVVWFGLGVISMQHWCDANDYTEGYGLPQRRQPRLKMTLLF